MNEPLRSVRSQWLTTAPHPNPRKWKTCEVDCGQRGWKMHAVLATDKETLEQVGRRRALCGLKPAHGWGLDLFIDAKCKRCEAVIAKAGNVTQRHTYGTDAQGKVVTPPQGYAIAPEGEQIQRGWRVFDLYAGWMTPDNYFVQNAHRARSNGRWTTWASPIQKLTYEPMKELEQ